MMASQENMSNVKPHPCSEVSFIYKRTDIKYIVICSTVNIDHSFMMCTNIAIMKYFLYEKRNN